jgi:protein involved in polysaccharide export with SLBB domain
MASAAATERILSAGDCVLFTLADNGASRHCFIDSDGVMTAPLGARIEVSGKTLKEAEELVKEFYAQWNTIGHRSNIILTLCDHEARKARNPAK